MGQLVIFPPLNPSFSAADLRRAEKEGFSVGNITKCPMDGLLKYHKS